MLLILELAYARVYVRDCMRVYLLGDQVLLRHDPRTKHQVNEINNSQRITMLAFAAEANTSKQPSKRIHHLVVFTCVFYLKLLFFDVLEVYSCSILLVPEECIDFPSKNIKNHPHVNGRAYPVIYPECSNGPTLLREREPECSCRWTMRSLVQPQVGAQPKQFP